MQFKEFDPADYLKNEYEVQFFLGVAHASCDPEHIQRAEAAAQRARARFSQEQKQS